MSSRRVQHLVVDTNAFINGANIKNIGENVYTIQEVIDEVTCKKQLRHLSVLAYDLIVKDVFPENIKFVTDFSKKTGDYASLSAVDIKVVALAYQLEKEKVGTAHLNATPVVQRDLVLNMPPEATDKCPGFFRRVDKPKEDDKDDDDDDSSDDELDQLHDKINALRLTQENAEESLLVPVQDDDVDKSLEDDSNKDVTKNDSEDDNDDVGDQDEDDESDDGEWITVNNIAHVKDQEDDSPPDEAVTVSCITADFAMQNILKQIGLNVTSYDGKLIRRVRTFILRCYACFKTTSVMTKRFCPKCGNPCLKKVAVTLDENGHQHIFINTRRPLTGRGKRFTLPAPKSGHHAQNPILNADQKGASHKPSKLARTKNNPLNPDFIAGFSPFVMRDVNSKSAVLGIRNQTDIKNWMRKNPNEVRKKRK